MASGGNRIAIGWTLATICWLFAVMMLVMPMDYEGVDSDGDGVEDDCDMYPYDARYADDTGLCDGSVSGMIGSSVCCCLSGFLCLLIVDSGRKAKAAAASQIIFVAQQPAQQVVHHHTTHTYVPQQVVPQQVVPQQAPPTAMMTSTQAELLDDLGEPEGSLGKSQAEWAKAARNLEMARDWEEAAQAYQKAGLYVEAGRIRQNHMEKDDSQVKINIDRIGDNIQDSVVMKDGDSQNDPNQP